MATLEAGYEYLSGIISKVLNPPEEPKRRRNPERRKDWEEFLNLSQTLFQDHGLVEIPKWPSLEKLTRPIELTIGGNEVSVQAAYHADRYGRDYAYHDITSIIYVLKGQDQFHSLFAVDQRHSRRSVDGPLETFGTRAVNHLNRIASDGEVAGGLQSLRWLESQLK